jgi:GT2 family glycosyltransferase
VILVDDERIADEKIEYFRNILEARGFALNYIQKKGDYGLFKSRIIGIAQASGEIVFFMDDDVELETNYLTKLFIAFEQFPGVVGIGGTDVLHTTPNCYWRWWARLFGYDSGNPGKLSAGGFGGSMIYWHRQQGPFITEYLSGCNMSFRKSIFRNLESKDWLLGYSLGEDLYLSFWARQYGTLLVVPDMKVAHNQSIMSRDSYQKSAYQMIANHFCLLQFYRAPWMRYIAFCWTVLGLFIKGIFSKHRAEILKGYARGTAHVLWQRLPFTKLN